MLTRAPCGEWVTCLDLNRNGLGSAGCRELGAALGALQSLEILQASGARAKMLHAQLDADAVAVRVVTADGAEMRTVARVVGDEM